MKICVFDTETTGFPVRDGKLDQQPYIIQFAAIMGEFNTETKEYEEKERYNILIKPKIAIPFASSQVHGIYDRDVADKQYISEHIDTIIQILNRADIVAGHNVSFDEEVLGFELARLGRVGDYTPIKTICTMRGSTEYCKLQGRGFAFKPPKLSELHKFLFNEWFEGAHDAMVDVEATMRSLVELIRRDVIQIEASNVMRLF